MPLPRLDLYEQATQINYVHFPSDDSNPKLPWLVQTIDIATALEQRAAKLAMLNLLPLGAGLTFGFLSHVLRIRRSAVAWSHRWFGRVITAQTYFMEPLSSPARMNPAALWVLLLVSPPRRPST
ncbi:uncharacterized protein BO88DRAFT_427288 [Aspergillus vadensis CBS 113365]|uniref:Uncharacterized protein n=1 Tax=Aspergillus vadensis (strain CBS 113365 / IMI 142717 / IBT 24658) TaxID=1448311 RepID=A0A319B3P0_ASPVC|nr:hypothetical protein BO88DRAFT_427288 [Aspergillus vadensis CBS 113365]PYH67129.1 hypothetical protein BO88DRAFT_427288 [Aspergillus vadensis CBS 113365]